MSETPIKINTGVPLWTMISGGIIIAAMWGTLSAQTSSNTNAIKDMQKNNTDVVKTLTDLRITTGQLQASVGNMQTDVSFIKNRVK